MPLSEEEKIKATILYHLRRKKVIGGVHTHFDAVRKGFPSHWGKDVSNLTKKLVKRRFLILKQASYGLQVSLNKDKIQEIDDFIKKVLGFEF